MTQTLIQYGSPEALYGSTFYGGAEDLTLGERYGSDIADYGMLYYGGTTGAAVTITGAGIEDNGQTLANQVVLTVVFQGTVNSFAAEDIVTNNCTVSDFSGSDLTYTFTISAIESGRASVLIPSGIATGELGTDSEQASFAVFFAEGTTGSAGGTLTQDTAFVGNITLTDNVVVGAGKTLTIDASAYIESQDYVIVVRNGGVVDTGDRRLPEGSFIRSTIFIID